MQILRVYHPNTLFNMFLFEKFICNYGSISSFIFFDAQVHVVALALSNSFAFFVVHHMLYIDANYCQSFFFAIC